MSTEPATPGPTTGPDRRSDLAGADAVPRAMYMRLLKDLHRYQDLDSAARYVLAAHSLPEYGERDHDLALEALVKALKEVGRHARGEALQPEVERLRSAITTLADELALHEPVIAARLRETLGP